MPETKSSSHTHTNTSTKSDTLPASVISTSTSQEIYDVVVIGAGPIGLATAIGLRKCGIENVLVIDQTRAFRQIGQTLDLLPNGLKALKYLDPNAYEEVKNAGLGLLNPKQSNSQGTVEPTQKQQPPKASPQWVYKNLQGEIIRSISLSFDDWFKDYGEGRVSISWYNLQTTLRQLLPQDQVKANHRCINVVNEPEKGCVRIDCVSDTRIEANPYAYWTDGQKDNDKQPRNSDISPQKLATKSIRAKLIVAADGINSTVRSLLYTDTQYDDFARPEYSGFAAIFCREIAEVPKELWTKLEEHFLQGSRIVTITNDEITGNSVFINNIRIMLFRRQTGEFGYIIHLALPLDSLQEKSESSLIDLALQELEKAGFPDALKQLVSLSPPAKMQQRPYYVHRASISDSLQVSNPTDPNPEANPAKIPPAWSVGRIVLVGDAAHGMPPFMAQGANQGLEDALIVTTLIAKIAEENNWDNLQAIAKAFEKYEHLRRPLMAYVQEATLKRSPHSSDKEWEDYSQQMYCRNFDQVIEAL
ncbi:FAD-dependent monooxygenase [Nostoc sp. UCD121]|uniref:FAD-dependent oxidoreductase n=1 Tax=unclassified Nostoc TaxID=2593658 RepID=UPI00162AC06E|nr:MULTISPECIES: NAD(P)/FAD-dependent oxidoreductase [unclassified Nostoc]MBC1221967.1 FAD-dependent monooxygenase [Nostoc sp. UCD120]MBC1276375.1 FAD-dependent monooxygenase [Nostoc sp. UCD121]MBC1293675.1 FAD-dependent monooxygenase [Nostoc sp. UCD122]